MNRTIEDITTQLRGRTEPGSSSPREDAFQ
jgi:hypothetical protein